jgi:hypothetical protein
MRAAMVFGRISVPVSTKHRSRRIKKESTRDPGRIVTWDASPEERAMLRELCPDVFGCALNSALWAGPHTDEVIGDITLGVIIEGDHYLFTGNGRRVGDLIPGTVYALLNKKLHGAFARDMKNPTPLVFITCEPKVAEEDWASFCIAIGKVLKVGNVTPETRAGSGLATAAGARQDCGGMP